MRWVSTRVLPEPAPATISSGEPGVGHRVALWAVEAGQQRFRVELGARGPAR